MPRLSAAAAATASLRVDGRPERLVCRPEAPQAVQETFRRIVESVAPEHFAPGDAPLIERYAETCVQAERAAAELERSGPVDNGKLSPWLIVQEKSVRAAVALAGKLRLAPHSRISADKAKTTTAGVDRRTDYAAAIRFMEGME